MICNYENTKHNFYNSLCSIGYWLPDSRLGNGDFANYWEMKIASKELEFDELVEAFKILHNLEPDKKEIIVVYITRLNNAVRDYENRINNAVNSLMR